MNIFLINLVSINLKIEIMKNKLVILLCAISVLMFFSSCSSLCDTLCNPPKPLKCDANGIGLISRATSDSLSLNYKTSITGLTNFGEGSSDSRSVWLSYEEMARYMCILKQEYEARPEFNGDIDLRKLGIRIYFGRYPTQKELSENEELSGIAIQNEEANTVIRALNQRTSDDLDLPEIKYGEKHCVFFVPTYESENENGYYQKDFMLDELTTIKAPSGILLPRINKNHGGLAPPERADGAEYLIDRSITPQN